MARSPEWASAGERSRRQGKEMADGQFDDAKSSEVMKRLSLLCLASAPLAQGRHAAMATTLRTRGIMLAGIGADTT